MALNLRFNSFISGNFLGFSDSSDPDVSFFSSVPEEQTKYFSFHNITVELFFSEQDAFSILHLNIRSLNKNIEHLKTFLAKLGFGFQIICLTESWYFADACNKNIYGQPGYTSVHHVRNYGQRGEICIFLHDPIIFKLRPDLSINNEKNNEKNILISNQYRQPSSKDKIHEVYHKNCFSKSKTRNKPAYIVSNLNLNLPDYNIKAKVKSYINLLFQNNYIKLHFKTIKFETF